MKIVGKRSFYVKNYLSIIELNSPSGKQYTSLSLTDLIFSLA